MLMPTNTGKVEDLSDSIRNYHKLDFKSHEQRENRY